MTPLLAILTLTILILGVIPTLHPGANAQVLNDRDNDGIEDESDPCRDDPDTACTEPPPAFACDPNVQSCPEPPPEEVTGGTPPDVPVGPSPPSPEIIFCIPNVEACNKTDVLINEAGDLICDPKVNDCSSYLPSTVTTGVQAQTTTQITYCNPYAKICNPTDVLVDDMGSVICDPKIPVYDCSQFFKTQGPPPEVVRCTPSLQTCNPTDVLLDESGNTLCDPSVNDCSKYHVSTVDNTPRAKPNVYQSIWTHYPVHDDVGLVEAQEEQQVQDEIDKFACEFAEHASEAVGMVYACLKVGEEFKHALKDPTKVMSPKEIAFCGFGAIGQFEKKVSILDPIGWAAGKEGSLVCKGTIAVKNWIQGNAVEDFLNEDYDRVQKERKIWCTNYGATLDEFGHCWDLEIDYDNCAKAQTFWTTTEPEKYGWEKIKLRDGFNY